MRSILATTAFALVLTGAAHAERLTDRPLVDADWLEAHLDNGSLTVIDIRPVGNAGNPYDEGHIEGAVSAPYGSFGWRATVDEVVGQLPPVPQIAGRIGSLGIGNDDHVVIVPVGDSSSDFGSATRVYWTFKVLGHDAVSILDGGWRAWTEAGKPVSADPSVPTKVVFEPAFRPELVADADELAAAQARGATLVDARPSDQYLGRSKSPVARVPGRIPGAVNLEQSKLYDGKAGSFASKDAIAALAEQVGMNRNNQEITYCNTGHWASLAWFGLSEVLGEEDVKLYDGSMADWTSDPSRAVENASQ